jgi:hypothetical protein
MRAQPEPARRRDGHIHTYGIDRATVLRPRLPPADIDPAHRPGEGRDLGNAVDVDAAGEIPTSIDPDPLRRVDA